MQIECPNCATAYEIPDAVFGGRPRKLRCENCGTQWRAGPPGGEAAPQATTPQATAPAAENGLPPSPEARRVFGKPIDAAAQAEFQEAMDREAMERAAAARAAEGGTPTPPALGDTGASAGFGANTDSSTDSEDPFINLVMAARSRSIEFEPDAPPEPRFKISSPALVGTLLTLFVLSVGFLLLHAR